MKCPFRTVTEQLKIKSPAMSSKIERGICEINRDFFCNNYASRYDCDGHEMCAESGCWHRHRKWPTLKQFLEEYGKEYQDDGAVYFSHYNPHAQGWGEWLAGIKGWVIKTYKLEHTRIICACTPWGCPPRDGLEVGYEL